MLGIGQSRRRRFTLCAAGVVPCALTAGNALASNPFDSKGLDDTARSCWRGIASISVWIVMMGALVLPRSVHSQCLRPPIDMVGWWPLDEPAGAAVVHDIANFDNKGTPKPGGTLGPPGDPQSVLGKVQRAVCFDSNSQVTGPYIEVPDHAELNFGAGDLSIDAWVKAPGLGSVVELPIVDKLDIAPSGSTGTGYGLTLVSTFGSAAQLKFIMADGGTLAEYHSASTITLNNTWNHVAVTLAHQAGIVKLYINGASVPLSTNPTVPPGSTTNIVPLLIGETRLLGKVQELICIDELELFKRVLDPAEVQAIWAADSLGKCKPCVSPPPDLIDWWPFDERTGVKAGDVAGGFNNDGNYGTSPANPIQVLGKVDYALKFDGIDDYVSVPDHPEINFLGDCKVDIPDSFTICTWVKCQVSSGLQVILDKRVDPSCPIGYSLYIFNGRLGFQMANGQGSGASCGPGACCFNYGAPGTSPNVADGQWHFVAVTVLRPCRAAFVGNFYVDGGAPVGSFTPLSGSLVNTAPLQIGRRDPAFGDIYFNGCVDELQFFDRDLSLDELDGIFIASASGKCKPNVPSASERGVIVLMLVMLTVGALTVMRRRGATVV